MENQACLTRDEMRSINLDHGFTGCDKVFFLHQNSINVR